jgi:hypothetical protein
LLVAAAMILKRQNDWIFGGNKRTVSDSVDYVLLMKNIIFNRNLNNGVFYLEGYVSAHRHAMCYDWFIITTIPTVQFDTPLGQAKNQPSLSVNV